MKGMKSSFRCTARMPFTFHETMRIRAFYTKYYGKGEFLAATRVELLMHFTQMRIGDMSVDLRGRNARMTQ